MLTTTSRMRKASSLPEVYWPPVAVSQRQSVIDQREDVEWYPHGGKQTPQMLHPSPAIAGTVSEQKVPIVSVHS